MDQLTKEILYGIQFPAPKEEIKKQIKYNWDQIAKPLDSMGKFEDVTVKIGGILEDEQIDISKKAVLIFCADNGIVEEGVSQSGQEVTAIVAESMANGNSSVCKMAKAVGVHVKIIDIGINNDANDTNGMADSTNLSGRVISRKIRKGTRNFRKEPAMTEDEALQAIKIGIELARDCKKEGYRILAMGEMGIGNTTTSAAVASALLKCDPLEVTGRGAGLSDQGFSRKRILVQEGIEKYKLWDADPLKILAAVGGFDIAGLAGLCIGGALYKIPVVMDGVISGIAALVAERLVPGIKEYLIPSHISREPAAMKIMEELGLSPFLYADMALGEGTGAVMMLSLLDTALCIYEDRTDFQDIQMENYTRF